MKRLWQKAMQSHKTTRGEYFYASVVDTAFLFGVMLLVLWLASLARSAELVPGSVLVSRNQEERLNEEIPGTMNHLAIVSTDGQVLESMVGVGVQKITLADYLARPYETPLVLLPKDSALGQRAAEKAASLVGTKFRKTSSIFRNLGPRRQEKGLNCVALVKVCYADADRRVRRVVKPDDIFRLTGLFEPARRLECQKPKEPEPAGERSILVKPISTRLSQNVCDLPIAWRVRNPDGSCAHCSTVMHLRWLQLFDKSNRWWSKYRRGEYFERHLERLKREGIKFIATSDGDTRVLDYAISSRRGAVVYWPVGHVVNFQGQAGPDVIILDNNRIQRMERHERRDWIRRWQRVSGCALVITSGSPPPPVPEPQT